MHRLLERQLRRILSLDPGADGLLGERLDAVSRHLAATDPELARALGALPDFLRRISDSYEQHDRDLALLRRSLEISSEELIEANHRLRAEADTQAHALETMQDAFSLLLEGYDTASPTWRRDSLEDVSEQILWLTRQREQMRQALALSEERFELAMRGANDGLWDWDVIQGTVYYSPRFKEMIGYGIGEIADRLEEWSQRVHPDDMAKTRAVLDAYMAGELPNYEVSFRFRHKNGRYLWVLSRGVAVRDGAGAPVRMVGTLTDITKRVELEAQLQQFKHVLDEHAIVSMSDVAGNITYANERFCTLSGYPRDELIGRNHRILKSGVHSDALYQDLWLTISQGRVWRGEICNRARDGRLYWVLATIAPILDEEGLPHQYISIRADITRNKEIEADLRQAKEAAEAASRAKSQFLANVSHEIRTPMNGVLGMIDLALATELDDEQRDYLDTAHASADILLDIINDILDLSKIEAGRLDIHPDAVDIHALLTDLIRAFEPRCRSKALQLTLRVDENLPGLIEVDSTRLRQILINLLGNAIKFTDTGGVVLDVHPVGDTLRFGVRDTGIGIPPDKQTEIFQAFSQADGSITRKFGGTGLGLTISRRLVELMGGFIGLMSTPGQGSEFFFTLPLRPASGPRAAAEPDPAPASGQRHEGRILLAEDNPINQKLVVSLLTKAGYGIATALTGREALDRLAQEPFDLVLMDMQMPDLDGIEATRLIRQRERASGARPIPIIAITANAYASDRARCLEAGMNDFITKPLARDALLATLRRHLHAS